MSTTELIARIDSDLAESVLAIQQPRTDYELATFVVGQHDSEPRRWAQCVLEEQQKVLALKRSIVAERMLLRKIEAKEAIGSLEAQDEAELLRIELTELKLAAVGAERELLALEAIRQSFGRSYTREELNQAETEYWRLRLTRQASQEIAATGRVGVGNLNALRQAGLASPHADGYVADVERRMLEASGSQRILIAVPTLISKDEIRTSGLRCLAGWTIPGVFQQRTFVVDGRPVADAYNEAAAEALNSSADYLLCVEDDHVIPEGAFERLWHLHKSLGPKSIVGAWYPQRKHPRTGTAIVVRDGQREYLQDDGQVHDVYVIPQGFTLIPTSAFRAIPHPWFATTGVLSQDSFFSQLAREHGYTLHVDTSLRIQHVDRETGQVFE